VVGFAVAALVLGGVGAWFASANPDGLEWALARAGGKGEATGTTSAVHETAARIQRKSAWLPGYDVPADSAAAPAIKSWPAVRGATSLSGICGGLAVLVIVGLLSMWLRRQPMKEDAGRKR